MYLRFWIFGCLMTWMSDTDTSISSSEVLRFSFVAFYLSSVIKCGSTWDRNVDNHPKHPSLRSLHSTGCQCSGEVWSMHCFISSSSTMVWDLEINCGSKHRLMSSICLHKQSLRGWDWPSDYDGQQKLLWTQKCKLFKDKNIVFVFNFSILAWQIPIFYS